MLRNLLIVCLVGWSCISPAHFTTIKNKCPSPENLRKCTCKLAYGGIQVTCSSFSTDEEVKQRLDALQGYAISSLELSQITASSVPTDLFKGLSIQELSLEKIKVKDASFRRGQRHLQGLEDSLTSLTIKNSFSKESPLLNFPLDHLQELQAVTLEDNNIIEVGNDWFTKGPEQLMALMFERNNIEELGDHAFSALSNLQILTVSGNLINSVTRTMLPTDAYKLEMLDLSNNKIRKLPSDIFSRMPSLDTINLKNNLLHTLEENTWTRVMSWLSDLKLDGNSMECDDKLRWICSSKRPFIFAKCVSPPKYSHLDVYDFCNH